MDLKAEKQFLEAYKKHTDALFRYCYFKTLNRDEAKDLLQDTFVKTWEYIRNGGEILNIKAFFYRTAHNLVIDLYRKKKTLSLDELYEGGFDIGAKETVKDLENQIDGARALKMLDQIPEAYREVIFMQYVDELSVTEISEILGESPNNISVKIHRGLEKMKKLYQNKDE